MELVLDHGFLLFNATSNTTLLDGVPCMNFIPHYAVGPLNTTSSFGAVSSNAFCQFAPPPHYNRLIWDPELSVLFYGSNSPNAPPGESTSSAAWVIPVAVTVPITIVVVAAILIAFAVSSRVQTFFRPYRSIGSSFGSTTTVRGSSTGEGSSTQAAYAQAEA